MILAACEVEPEAFSALPRGKALETLAVENPSDRREVWGFGFCRPSALLGVRNEGAAGRTRKAGDAQRRVFARVGAPSTLKHAEDEGTLAAGKRRRDIMCRSEEDGSR